MPEKAQDTECLTLAGLSDAELQRLRCRRRDLRRLLRLLPCRHRYLLRLVHVRGASQRELAGLLGVSPRTVRRTLRRARDRLRDPLNLTLVACWNRLTEAEQRLLRLHRLQGVPLRRLAWLGLIPAPPEREPPGAAATLTDLRSLHRRLERKAHRLRRRRERPIRPDPARAAPPPPPQSDR